MSQAKDLDDKIAVLVIGLSLALRRLDRSAIASFVAIVRDIGVTDNVALRQIFADSVGAVLADAYVSLGNVAATAAGLPAPIGLRAIGEEATTRLVDSLTARAMADVGAVVTGGAGLKAAEFTRRVEDVLLLTEKQRAWVAKYEQQLRANPTATLDRSLRDPAFDAVIGRGDMLSEVQIRNAVANYRLRIAAWRAKNIAANSLGEAASRANIETWLDAEAKHLIVPGSKKFWVDMDDLHVRPAHREIPGLNAGGVALNDYFITPLGPMLYPHDPAGLPDNINGCRCLLVIRAAAGAKP